jgi:hypothetical protein
MLQLRLTDLPEAMCNVVEPVAMLRLQMLDRQEMQTLYALSVAELLKAFPEHPHVLAATSEAAVQMPQGLQVLIITEQDQAAIATVPQAVLHHRQHHRSNVLLQAEALIAIAHQAEALLLAGTIALQAQAAHHLTAHLAVVVAVEVLTLLLAEVVAVADLKC